MRKWLIAIRKNEGLTQEQVASLVGVNFTLIGKYELGKRRPSPDLAKTLAQKLNFATYGVDWTKFFEDEPQSNEALSGSTIGG